MAREFRDYYAVLGVKKDATPEELKQAYRRLAKVHHPDLQPEKEKAAASEKFKELNEAYEVLSRPEKRAKYDQFGADWERGPRPPEEEPRRARSGPPPRDAEEGAGFSGFSDFFEDLYGADAEGLGSAPRSARRARSGPRRGQDVEAEMSLSLEDAVRGGEKKITLDVPALCPSCGGTGRRGSGFCPDCGGVGELAQAKTITARLPAAARDGMRLRLRGQGAAAPGGGESGDLYLRIRLLPHPSFRVAGADLETTVTVMPWTAALGGEASVPSLDGPIRVKISAGTHAGRVLRVAGKGLGREGGGRGDLHAAVRIDIPDRSDPRLEKLYREMKEASS
jgi:DnaJ-class molecular chaperone